MTEKECEKKGCGVFHVGSRGLSLQACYFSRASVKSSSQCAFSAQIYCSQASGIRGYAMRAITFLAAIGALFLIAVTAQADDESVSDACAAVQAGVGQAVGADGSPIDLALCAPEGSTNLTTVTTGNVSQSVGQVDGEPVNVVSSEVGNVSVATGQVGDKQINVTSTDLGNVTVSAGQVDGRAVSTSTVEVGSSTVTVGTVGEQSINRVTNDIGNSRHTSGQVGDQSVNAVTTQFGNTSVTTGQVGGEPVSLTTVEVGNVTVTTGQAGGKPVTTTTVKIGNVEHKIELPGN